MSKQQEKIKPLQWDKTILSIVRIRKELEQMIVDSFYIPQDILHGKSKNLYHR